jgi:hypothetical protein
MAINGGGAAGGAMAGAQMGSMFGPWGTAIGAVGGGIMGAMSKKSKTSTFDPMSLYTPEQRASILALQSLASTGSGAGIDLGKAYSGDLGYYTQNQGEIDATANLQGLMGGQDITGARDVYARMAGNKFNPDDPSSGYASFSKALAKSGAESQDAINRQAAITGGAFGSGRGRETASLQADLANQRGQYLASLYNQGENRAMQGAQGLEGLVGTQQNLFQQVQQQSAIERLLKDQKAKDQYTDFGRMQDENMTRIGLMKDQWAQPMGATSTTTPGVFNQMLNSQLSNMGSGAGGAGGSMGGLGSIMSLFKGFGSGNQMGTGIGGGTLGGQTQSQILGFNTAKYR